MLDVAQLVERSTVVGICNYRVVIGSNPVVEKFLIFMEYVS